MRLTDWVLAGRLDYQEHTPWRRAPMTEAECRKRVETDEAQAYWSGFYSGSWDALRIESRKKRRREQRISS